VTTALPSIIPIGAARALALEAQGLTTPNGSEPEPTLDALHKTVDRLWCVQIDTLHMVARAHYITMWARHGAYDPADFERLIFDPAERRLFEYWSHAASIVPLSEYRYYDWKRASLRANPGSWFSQWLAQEGSTEVVSKVLDHIRSNGAMRGKDFEDDGPKRGSWWDWKPAKRALEHHFATGDLMVTSRHNFQRIYDVPERVLPEWVDRSPVSREEAREHFIERGIKAMGIGIGDHAADYVYFTRTPTRKYQKNLIDAGKVIPVNVEVMGGQTKEMVIHRDHLPTLQRALDGDIRPGRTTFMSFFDSLFWPRDRDEWLWDYVNMLECYKPAPQRRYGYLCHSILHHDRMVGRFDPKLERKKGTLILRALYLEAGVKPDEELVAGVAAAMRDFMKFHKAKDLAIEKSEPAAFSEKLMKAL
jgi:uncharacterized protein YcaQ